MGKSIYTIYINFGLFVCVCDDCLICEKWNPVANWPCKVMISYRSSFEYRFLTAYIAALLYSALFVCYL